MKLRNAAVNTLLVLVSAGVAFLAIEVALRISDYPRREAKLICLDPIVHNVFCPNVSGKAGHADTPVSINKDGMADREYPYEKPAGTLRIALLGDSVTASIYTEKGRKFEEIWEAALTQRLGRPVEILNFGLDGTGTWEQLQLFHLRARKFHPDYVVLGFYWANDIWNNDVSLAKRRPNPLNDEYAVETWTTPFKVAHRNSIRWLWNHSAAFQLLDTLKTTVERTFDYKRALERAQATAKGPADPDNVDDAALHWDSGAWDLTRKLILKLKAECDAAGAPLIVFGIPMLEQITRKKALPYSEFRAFLSTHQITAIDAFDELAALGGREKAALYIGDHAHLSDEGHRFFAEAALPRLEAALSTRASRAVAGTAR